MQTIMDSYSAGIQIADIELQGTEPPDRVESAFREVDSARQDRERFQREAEREEERVINETRGKVNQQISEAKGQAAAIVNRAKGDAERFERLIQQYEEAPDITETRMFLETMQDVMKKSRRVYIVDRNVKGLLPLLDLKKETGK